MAAFEALEDLDAELTTEIPKLRSVHVSRPAYTEEDFQREHQRATKENVSPIARVRRKLARVTCSTRTVSKFFTSLLPVLYWLPKYEVKTTLPRDLLSGLTVGIFRIPQGMAHAILADVSPINGLYTSFFPPIVYAIFGTSRQISIGTFAVVSIMTGQAIDKAMEVRLKDLNEMAVTTATTTAPQTGLWEGNVTYTMAPTTHSGPLSPITLSPAEEMMERARLGALLAMLVGMFQIGMSVFRLGFVTCYLAEPLVRGFTTGAAFHVFTSQFNKLFGVPVNRYSGMFALPKTYVNFFTNINQTNASELINSLLILFILIIVKELQDKYKDKLKYPLPTELVVVILSTAAAYTGNFAEKHGMKVVGDIASNSLPAPVLPPFQYTTVMISDAFVIAIVGFSVSVSLAAIFAKRNKYEVSSNQELLGYGSSNMISSLFMCYPSCGSLSRSLLQDLSGGRTQIAGVISAIPILLILFLLTQFFESLPEGCLAAIVVVALRGIFRQFRDIKVLWRYSKIDCMLWIVTCAAVVLLGVDIGLGVGVATAIFSIVIRTQHPKCSIMGHIPNTDIYRDLAYYDATEEIPGLKIFRLNAPFYFANAEYVKQHMYSMTGIDPPKILQERAKEEKRLAKLKKIAEGKGKKARERLMKEHTEGLEDVQNGVLTAEHHDHHDSCEKLDKNGKAASSDDLAVIHPESLQTVSEGGSSQVSRGTHGVNTIIMDFGAISFLDAMGLSTLKVIVADYKKVDVEIVLANCRGAIRSLMYKSGFLELIGLDKIYITLHDAVLHSVHTEHHLLKPIGCRLIPSPGGVVNYRLSATDADEPSEPSGSTVAVFESSM